MLTDSIREEVKDIRNTVNELKESLTFSQKDIDDAKPNISKIETKVTKADEDISEAYGDIELKESLTFSQKDIDDAKPNISKIETKVTKADEDISEAYGDIEYRLDGQESLENYSRRNNIKVFGIPEKDTKNGSDPEVWGECEAAVKKRSIQS